MVTKEDQYGNSDCNFLRMIKHNVTPLDLFIISKLNDVISLDDLIKLAEKKFKIKNSKKIIEERLKKLQSEDNPEKKIILYTNPKYVMNPAKLYDGIYIVLIKINLPSFETKNFEIGTREVYETIIDLNSKPRFGKPIKQLYTMVGWMFDFLGIVFENNLSRFNSFKDYLLKEGIVKTVDIIQVDTESGFFFNPVSTPDHTDFKRFLVHYQDRMNTMADELTEDDVLSTKTINYFDRDDYGLEVISKKNKGEIFPIDLPELKIGRYDDNEIIIQDITVSRRHAKISKIGNTYIFKDESSNGSYVNNNHVNYDEIELHDGDIIKIGKTKYHFHKLCDKKKK